jgi:hypothetical protein
MFLIINETTIFRIETSRMGLSISEFDDYRSNFILLTSALETSGLDVLVVCWDQHQLELEQKLKFVAV